MGQTCDVDKRPLWVDCGVSESALNVGYWHSSAVRRTAADISYRATS
jgi:hypothetical protein